MNQETTRRMTRQEWERKKYHGYADVRKDGSRWILELEPETGATVLVQVEVDEKGGSMRSGGMTKRIDQLKPGDRFRCISGRLHTWQRWHKDNSNSGVIWVASDDGTEDCFAASAKVEQVND